MKEELFTLRLNLGITVVFAVFVGVNAISQNNQNENLGDKLGKLAADVEMLKLQSVAHNAITDSTRRDLQRIDSTTQAARYYAAMAAANTLGRHMPNNYPKNSITHGRQFADRK